MTNPVAIIDIYDTIHANVSKLPAARQAAGYVTGTPDIEWTEEDFQMHPSALRIDQTPQSTAWNAFADVQDFEKGAVTLQELPSRVKAAQLVYSEGILSTQREPAVYVGAPHNATPVVNELIAQGVHHCPLAVAIPGQSRATAANMIVSSANTPWRIVWVQYAFGGDYDMGVADGEWLNTTSSRKMLAQRISRIDVHGRFPGVLTTNVSMEDGSMKSFSRPLNPISFDFVG